MTFDDKCQLHGLILTFQIHPFIPLYSPSLPPLPLPLSPFSLSQLYWTKESLCCIHQKKKKRKESLCCKWRWQSYRLPVPKLTLHSSHSHLHLLLVSLIIFVVPFDPYPQPGILPSHALLHQSKLFFTSFYAFSCFINLMGFAWFCFSVKFKPQFLYKLRISRGRVNAMVSSASLMISKLYVFLFYYNNMFYIQTWCYHQWKLCQFKSIK